MARPCEWNRACGAARELLRSAKTAEELRRAQAVLLPLDLGLSLEQTAQAIGRSVNATCAIRYAPGLPKLQKALWSHPALKPHCVIMR
ncbi:helix-turn-helix domain-containing protein [Acidithiobacillus sp. HP-11]|uniref:helix-turn-helix domain-containing protein n=1 Tax=Acidithiobacillus sp. HP-11 TaxID=2697656 RepID=UPI001D0D17F6|nr:helix-turn-helix domain-containing protein [Acidithiobacillus sp. HP-11]